MAQQAAQTQQMIMEQEDRLNQRDNDTKLQIAFKNETPEVVDNSIDNRKLDLERQKHFDNLRLAEQKRQDERDKTTKELGLKKEEIAVKKIAATKPAGSK